jgi:transposase
MLITTYVGLDASKSSITATVVDPLGQRLEQLKLRTSDSEFVQSLDKLPGEKCVVLEASNVWEHLYDVAASMGASVLRANPLKTPSSPRRHSRPTASIPRQSPCWVV